MTVIGIQGGTGGPIETGTGTTIDAEIETGTGQGRVTEIVNGTEIDIGNPRVGAEIDETNYVAPHLSRAAALDL